MPTSELQEFFTNQPIVNTSFFDEGPYVHHSKPRTLVGFVNTSSIATIAIDGYRQGVELTQQKHFDAGTVKIHAGEPGHVVRRNGFGMNKNFRHNEVFQELDYFNPVAYLRIQDSPTFEDLLDVMTFPIITTDNNQHENYVFDGIIEPLTIRAKASFFSIDVPFEAHEVKGALMGGNTDSTWGSDVIETLHEYNPTSQWFGFLDMVDMINGQLPLNGYFEHEKPVVKPFSDERFPRNVLSGTNYDDTMLSVLSHMSGSDDYMRLRERSASAGWTYGYDVSAGTDSITFGGMCY